MRNDHVHYGCGPIAAPESWLNFDCSPTLRFERMPVVGRLYTRNAVRFAANIRYGDIVGGLPVPKASCKAVYCSHVLEHLALADFYIALQHTFEILEPGGVFRLVVPDLEHLARNYLADGKTSASAQFMRASCLGKEQRRRGLRGLFTAWLGNSAHLWMWDERSMTEALAQQGFAKIRRAAFGDAEDRLFDEVENRERFEGSLAMQCTRGTN